VDDTNATTPAPDIPAAIAPNDAIDSQECDSVASVVHLEWVACYEAEMPRLIRYLMKCFGDSDMRDATEAAQNAFTELFANWDTVQHPRAWLRTVAFRQMLRQNARAEDSLDSLPREPAPRTEQPASRPASVRLELREEHQRVMDLLRQLPLTQRQVLALLYDQFSYREIAEIMGTKEATVRKNAERARASMKKLLGIT
jgi:RNA polymerase sigma factor (sigma-70 family)